MDMASDVNSNNERNSLIDSIQYRLFYAEINLDKIKEKKDDDDFESSSLSIPSNGLPGDSRNA